MTRLPALIREDWETHDRSYSSPGLHALVVQRIGRWRLAQPAAARRVVGIVYWVLKTVVRNVYGAELYDTTVIGRRVHIVQHSGVVLGSSSTIGDDVTIGHNVTLGALGPDRPGEHPTVGDRVVIGAGAVIAGPVDIGDDVTVGPRAIVLQSVPSGSTVLAPAARIKESSN